MHFMGLAEMTEEQIRRTPAANINIFVGDYLRVLSVKNRDGDVKLEDGFAEIPERPAYPSHCFRQMRVARMVRPKLTHLGIFSVGRVTQFAGRTETPPLLGPHAGYHEQPIRSHATYGEGVKSDPGLSQHWNFSKLRKLSACPSAFS